MPDKDIQTLIKSLTIKNRTDLARLLEGASSKLDVTDQYGSYLFSQISSFEVFAPIENYYKLKNLDSSDYKIILDSVLDIYPSKEHSPEVVSVRFLIKQEEGEKENLRTKSNIMRFFISYSHNDKAIAGQLKNNLEYFGFEAFLAHEDIKPTEEWQVRILEELDDCEMFLPLLTDKFKQSEWTGQETGIAHGKNKLIIPLKINIDPFGFMGKWQALPLNISDIKITCQEIINIVVLKGDKSKLIYSLIRGFSNSHNFAEANEKAPLLAELSQHITFEQVLEIIRNGFDNDQIYWAHKAKDFIVGLIRNNPDKHPLIIEQLRKDRQKLFNNAVTITQESIKELIGERFGLKL
jgi:hypothetical protein